MVESIEARMVDADQLNTLAGPEIITLADMPPGETRHPMRSKSVPAPLLAGFNALAACVVDTALPGTPNLVYHFAVRSPACPQRL